MSDDLISRRTLLDSMDKRYKEKNGIVQDNLAEGFIQMEKLIKEQPTAYDVDKVAKQLEKEGDNIFLTHFPEEGQEFMDNGIAKGFWWSAEIVKSGGVADE